MNEDGTLEIGDIVALRSNRKVEGRIVSILFDNITRPTIYLVDLFKPQFELDEFLETELIKIDV